MDFWTIFMMAYVSVTAAAALMTFKEQRDKGLASPAHVFGGYALCAVWPAVVAALLLFYRPGLQES